MSGRDDLLFARQYPAYDDLQIAVAECRMRWHRHRSPRACAAALDLRSKLVPCARIARIARCDFSKRRPDNFLLHAVARNARVRIEQARHGISGLRGAGGGWRRDVAIVVRSEIFNDSCRLVWSER